MIRPPPTSTLFPYTTLFRSERFAHDDAAHSFVSDTGIRSVIAVPLAGDAAPVSGEGTPLGTDRKSTRLNSSHPSISYAVFCLKKKKNDTTGGFSHSNQPDCK